MFGLAVLFLLALWLAVTLLGVVAPFLLLRNDRHRRIAAPVCAFVVFMLLMGGWMVKWYVEYRVAKSYAAQMCQQAGIKIYVTPEEWKRQVGGEEAWRNIKWINRSPATKDRDKTVVFNQHSYKIFHQINERVAVYARNTGKPYVRVTDWIYYDSIGDQVLIQNIDVSAGTSKSPDDVSDWLKSWLNKIPSCKTGIELSQQRKLYFFEPLNGE